MSSVTFQVRIDEEAFAALRREVKVRNKESMALGQGRITISGFSGYLVRSGLAKIARYEDVDPQNEGAL